MILYQQQSQPQQMLLQPMFDCTSDKYKLPVWYAMKEWSSCLYSIISQHLNQPLLLQNLGLIYVNMFTQQCLFLF